MQMTLEQDAPCIATAMLLYATHTRQLVASPGGGQELSQGGSFTKEPTARAEGSTPGLTFWLRGNAEVHT